MSNCIGVSGATSESKESADRDAESDPKDPVLLVRFVGGRDCLKNEAKPEENISNYVVCQALGRETAAQRSTSSQHKSIPYLLSRLTV